MNIAIIDDCISDQQFLSTALRRYEDHEQMQLKIKKFDNGTIFLQEFKATEFDVVFLDIYMSGLDGIETAEQIRTLDNQCIVIFTTTSEQHAVRSYRVRAFDYLVKPYSYEQLADTMNLCVQSLSKQLRYLEVKEGRAMVKILISDILFTDYANHYIQIHTKSRIARTYMHFDEFAPLLLCFPQFLHCYRNCMINMDAVEMMIDQDFVLKNEERVPIAKAQRSEIRQKYADYIFEQLNGRIE